MNGPEHQGERPASSAEHRDEPIETKPCVYVASLSDYNAGRLHGVWVDATQEADEMWEAINTMLARSREPFAEEIAIHDFDNFGPVHLSEYESILTVSKIGRGFVEHGKAFLHWVSYIGTSDPDGLDRFEDGFLGHYASLEELGEELAGAEEIERLVEEHLPEFIRPYVKVDFEGFGRDLSGSCHIAEDSDGVYVFEA